MAIEFEDILRDVGDYGAYQKILAGVFLIPVGILTPMFFIAVIFMDSIPDHWCYIPEVAASNLSLEHQLILIRPKDDPSCTTYDINYTTVIKSGNWIPDDKWPKIPCPNGWQYDKSEYDATAVTRWNMVCSDSHYSSLLLSLTFAADLVGTPLFGHLSDVFGRKTIFFFLSFVTALTEIASTTIPNFTTFLVLRTINGGLVTVLYINSYVTLIELVNIKKRTLINGIGMASWSAGLCLLPLVAWLTRHWVRLSIFCSTCALSFFFYIKLLPESPRLLISKGRYKDAFEVLATISRRNGLKTHESDKLMNQIVALGEKIAREKTFEEAKGSSPLDLFRYTQIRKRFLLLTLGWIGTSMAYYGLLVNVKNIWGNEFLNFFLMSVSEFPSHIVTWICMQKIGRRWTTVGAFSITTVACLMPLIFRKDLIIVDLVSSFFGKFGSSASYMSLYQQSPELHPTPLRSLAMSLSATIGSTASLMVPFIADLAIYGEQYPFLVFAVVSFCGGISTSFLPETLNRVLPQTIEDAEDFETSGKYFSFSRLPKTKQESQSAETPATNTINISTSFNNKENC